MRRKIKKSELSDEHRIRIKRSNARLTIGLIIGIILFMIPSVFDAYTQWKQYPMVRTYDNNSSQIEEHKKDYDNYNKQVLEYQEHKRSKITQDISSVTHKDGMGPIGYVNIPAIKVKDMIIYHGTSDEKLAKGLGNMDFTSLPTGGKNTLASITGHTGMANRIFFDNIKFLKKGDIIELHTLGNTLQYKVTTHKVIDPNKDKASENFYVQKGKDMIALMTCTPVFINSHRLIVYAKRVPNPKPIRKVIRRDFFSFIHIWQILVMIMLLIFIIAYSYQRYRYNKLLHKIYDNKEKESLVNE